jgi:hypothetical protein
MEKTKEKKKSVSFVLTTILVTVAVVLAVKLILAYFMNQKSIANVFTIGDISIVLDEGATWNAAAASNSVPDIAMNIAPEDEIEKSPNIINNGRNSAYVYLKMYVPTYNNQDLFTYTINATNGEIGGWTKRTEEFHTTIDGQVFNIYTYQYDEVLEAGKTTDQPLFNSVIFAENIDFYPTDTNIEGQIKDIIIKAYGIQVGGGVIQSSNEITDIMTSDANETSGIVAASAMP